MATNRFVRFSRTWRAHIAWGRDNRQQEDAHSKYCRIVVWCDFSCSAFCRPASLLMRVNFLPLFFLSASAFGAFNTFDSSTFADSTCTVLPVESPRGFFASPSGNPLAAGTEDDPLDLQSALSAGSPVGPGGVLWLMEGTYKGTFVRCQPWRAKRRLVDPSSRETALLTRRAHSARGDAK